jgi:predicted RNase H-like HicB family nuclease
MLMKKLKTQQKDKMALEYQVNIAFDPRDNIFVARVPELENCHSHGYTPEEALCNAQEAIELWLETAKKQKIPIPLPMSRRKFSGKFVLRTPEELHAHLAEESIRRGKSMNDFVVELLSDALKRAV